MELFGRRERFGSHLGLERIELVCRELGNPPGRVKICALGRNQRQGFGGRFFLARVLQAGGLKVGGLFTSPHLEAYEERFQINGGPG